MVVSRAWLESWQAVRWDNRERLVVALVPLLVAAVLTWWVLGDAVGALVRLLATIGATCGLALLFVVVRIFTLPPRIACEAAEQAKERQERGQLANSAELQRLQQECAASLETISRERDELRRQVGALSAPPPRDPDGIFQGNRQVGSLVAAVIDRPGGQVRCEALHGNSDFVPALEFQFRDLALTMADYHSESQMGFGGQTSRQTYGQVICRIVGVGRA